MSKNVKNKNKIKLETKRGDHSCIDAKIQVKAKSLK